MQSKRKLPIGVQDFATIRNDGYLYVDKTDLIYNLANEGKTYFLSRPRRFGKRLLIFNDVRVFFRKARAMRGGGCAR